MAHFLQKARFIVVFILSVDLVFRDGLHSGGFLCIPPLLGREHRLSLLIVTHLFGERAVDGLRYKLRVLLALLPVSCADQLDHFVEVQSNFHLLIELDLWQVVVRARRREEGLWSIKTEPSVIEVTR